METTAVSIPAGTVELAGDLTTPSRPVGIVIFAHGSGSSRHSPRNQAVAARLRKARLATLLMDLLTPTEEEEEQETRHHRFDIQLLLERLVAATDFVAALPQAADLKVGYFGASTGAAAALAAAARVGDRVGAVVSRGGRPDLAGGTLHVVTAPTLLIVGGADGPVIQLNREAMARMTKAEVHLEVIPGATHLFPEPGALERVADLAADWFKEYLAA